MRNRHVSVDRGSWSVGRCTGCGTGGPKNSLGRGQGNNKGGGPLASVARASLFCGLPRRHVRRRFHASRAPARGGMRALVPVAPFDSSFRASVDRSTDRTSFLALLHTHFVSVCTGRFGARCQQPGRWATGPIRSQSKARSTARPSSAGVQGAAAGGISMSVSSISAPAPYYATHPYGSPKGAKVCRQASTSHNSDSRLDGYGPSCMIDARPQ